MTRRDSRSSTIGLERACKNPNVTVVIPTRDRAEYLSNCLKCVLTQVCVDFDVVVVDDGSRLAVTETPELAGLVHDERVRVIRHESSRGVAAARNRGIEAASGTWIAFLDDDDLWATDKLAAQIAAVTANPETYWSYTAEIALDAELNLIKVIPAPSSEEVARLLPWCNPVPASGSSVLALTESIREVGGFDEEFSTLADWDLWLQLSQRWPAAVVHRALVGYVRHAGSMYTDIPLLRKELVQLQRKWRKNFSGRVASEQRFHHDLDLFRIERRLGRPSQSFAFALRAAISGPSGPFRMAYVILSGAVRRMRPRRPSTIAPTAPAEVHLQLEQWRALDRYH
jgi:glycosyltransferase involved in cell wall biosynthesis